MGEMNGHYLQLPVFTLQGTLTLVERKYTSFLVNFVKAPQPDLQASVYVQQSFLQEITGRAETAVVSSSGVDHSWRKRPLDGAVDF